MTTSKRMGGMGKLSSFATTPKAQSEPETEQTHEPEQTPKSEPEPLPSTPKTTRRRTPPKLTTVNIKIEKRLHRWLTDTASQVRDNNDDPVPANDRVYPQHLINLAVELLKSSPVDWSAVRSIDDLTKQLKL